MKSAAASSGHPTEWNCGSSTIPNRTVRLGRSAPYATTSPSGPAVAPAGDHELAVDVVPEELGDLRRVERPRPSAPAVRELRHRVELEQPVVVLRADRAEPDSTAFEHRLGHRHACRRLDSADGSLMRRGPPPRTRARTRGRSRRRRPSGQARAPGARHRGHGSRARRRGAASPDQVPTGRPPSPARVAGASSSPRATSATNASRERSRSTVK